MTDDTPPNQFFWALTPNGWVTCDSFDARPADAVAVRRTVPPTSCNVEDGVGVSVAEQAAYGDSASLIDQFGQAPRYPIPQASLERIDNEVNRIFGYRGKHKAGWDALRNALIEARYLRGLLDSSGTGKASLG
jgi:hypothetical protein